MGDSSSNYHGQLVHFFFFKPWFQSQFSNSLVFGGNSLVQISLSYLLLIMNEFGGPGFSPLSPPFFLSPVCPPLCFIKLHKNQDSKSSEQGGLAPPQGGFFRNLPLCYKCVGENIELSDTRPGKHFLPASTSTRFIRHLLNNSCVPGPWQAIGTQRLITPHTCPWFVSGQAALVSQARVPRGQMPMTHTACLQPAVNPRGWVWKALVEGKVRTAGLNQFTDLRGQVDQLAVCRAGLRGLEKEGKLKAKGSCTGPG